MKKLVVFTGAGISADSGIQTFRGGPNALWENHSIYQVAHGDTWKQNFELVHQFYSARRAQLANVQPNEAHHMVKRLQDRYGERLTLVTQNIDDLFERAGCTNVLHVHGFLRELRCENCGNTWDIGYAAWNPDEQRCPHPKGKLPCNSKNGVRPNVVFFGEAAPMYRPMDQAINALEEGDVLLVIGTSGHVLPIGDEAEQSLATTILCNLETGDGIDDAQFDHVLHGRASERAPDLEKLVIEILG